MIRMVLDTNVVLDWLVFRDPRVQPLARVIEEGAAEVLTTVECTAELARVLAYPNLALTAERQTEILAAYARASRPWPVPVDSPTLPQCRDPDDQKFLELAAAAGAGWLFTRDLALLELARRASCGFRIARPEEALGALRQLGESAGV